MLEKIILFFLFFLPFQFALHPVADIDLPLARVMALGIFLFWIARSFFEKRVYLPRPKSMFFFLAYLLWAVSSLLWVENEEWTMRKILFLFSFFPLFLVFSSLLREKIFREKALKNFSIGAILIASISLLQFFSQFFFGVEKVFSFWTREILPFFLGPNFGAVVAEYPSLLVNISGRTIMRAIGLFPDPHMFSFFLGMSLFLVIVFARETIDKQRLFFTAGAVVIFIADLLTFSRGGYVGLIVGLGAFFLPSMLRTAEWKKQFLRMSMLLFLLITLIFLSPIGTRLLSSFSQTDTSNTERLRLWKTAGIFIGEHPLLGSGLGNYSLAVKPTATYREPIYVHNLYLDVAVELGLPGLLFFGGFLGVGIFSAWKKWQRKNNRTALAVFSSLLLFASHAFFETPLFSVHIMPLLLFLLALGAYNEKSTEGAERKAPEKS